MRKRVLAGLFLIFILLLSACGQGSEDNGAVSENENTLEFTSLKVGALFNPEESLDPGTATSPGSIVLNMSIYDSLATMDSDGVRLRMAENIEANEHLNEYTITLKEGLVYSDGVEAVGQDVISSLKYLSSQPMFQSMYADIDFERSKAKGYTAVLTLKEPASDFVEGTLAIWSPIARDGNFNGIGAGGYIYERGDAHTGFVLKSNEKYYAGEPSIHEIELLNIPDSSSKARALQTGEIDFAWGLDAASVKTLSNNDDIEFPDSSLNGASALVLVLNTRVAPFDDPEIRRAAKLTIDREKLVTTILGDYGEIGNDMLGKGFSTYPNDIVQTMPNKEEARKIFKEKGVSEFTIATSDVFPGLNNATKMMAQDFKEVGVNILIEELDPQTYYMQMSDLYQKPAFTFYWINRTPLTEIRSQVLKDSPHNVSGYYSSATEEGFKEAISTNDKDEQEKYIHVISKDIHDNGGDLIWGYQKDIAVQRKGLKVENNQTIPWLATAKFSLEE